ncbi:hypothetical protein chiPu_0003555 [Chiloscyllium punctatum]|uniref:Uncharacterized protein n=1 Tax=Chiloscyllium punctatum TaxID=137246 RepID=A0A401S416_CHIPU|nr:hypothetical protein [Chiloscyllium punctatum]
MRYRRHNLPYRGFPAQNYRGATFCNVNKTLLKKLPSQRLFSETDELSVYPKRPLEEESHVTQGANVIL